MNKSERKWDIECPLNMEVRTSNHFTRMEILLNNCEQEEPRVTPFSLSLSFSRSFLKRSCCPTTHECPLVSHRLSVDLNVTVSRSVANQNIKDFISCKRNRKRDTRESFADSVPSSSSRNTMILFSERKI